MNNFIPPEKLIPCSECHQDLVYIKAGIGKDYKSYEAYYKCPNDCRVKQGWSSYPFRIWARSAHKNLKT